LAADLVEAFRNVPSAHASDCMGRCVGAIGLRAFHGVAPMCGAALTVRTRPGDNLMIHKALEIAEAGDVLVIDGGGDLAQAVFGGQMRMTAITRKLTGVVVDGAIRDTAEFADGGFACFAKGANHRGPSKDGPGEINIPISCAGMVVHPGDLILGDLDGVICIPAADAAPLLPLVQAHAAQEAQMHDAIVAGVTDPDRFNAILRQKGVSGSLLTLHGRSGS
jgi:RraA family protein